MSKEIISLLSTLEIDAIIKEIRDMKIVYTEDCCGSAHDSALQDVIEMLNSLKT